MHFDVLCSNLYTGNNVSDHFRWANFGVFGQFFPINNANEWCYRIQHGELFCCPFNCECTNRFLVKIEQVFDKKLPFLLVQTKNPLAVSANCSQNFEKDLYRGQPLAKISTGQTIWHVSRVFRFPGDPVQK